MCLNEKDETNQILVVGNVHIEDLNVYLSIIIVE
jgi:hypothetical protein